MLRARCSLWSGCTASPFAFSPPSDQHRRHLYPESPTLPNAMSVSKTVLALSRSPCSAVRAIRVVPAARRAIATSSARSSHIGSLPIAYPEGVSVRAEPAHASGGSTARVRVDGPRGRLFVDLMPFVHLVHATPALDPIATAPTTAPASLRVHVVDSNVKHQRAVWGLTRSLIANAVVGVSTGYSLSLRLVGVGYRAVMDDIPGPSQRINLKLGYAHPVLIDLPSDVVASTPTTTSIVLSGIDKQRLGEVAARIRRWRKPEPYNVRPASVRPALARACPPKSRANTFVPGSHPLADPVLSQPQGKGIFVGDEVVRRKEVKSK